MIHIYGARGTSDDELTVQAHRLEIIIINRVEQEAAGFVGSSISPKAKLNCVHIRKAGN